MRGFVVAVMLTCALSAAAQSAGKAEVFPAQQIRAELDKATVAAKAAGSGGATLADYGSHKVQLSVRTASGGAEMHAHFDDIMLVQQGTATLITGGTLVDATTDANGESHGSAIRDGKTQTISGGDMVTVNAGVPHQLIIPAGTTYSAIVIKVREP
jgi:mannose-6-phosphate isomerase-like protein (cupin superfamily)